MEPAVTPTLVLRYLRELSTDLLAATVLTASGEPLAGPGALAQAAGGLLGAVRGAPLAEGRVDGHLVVVARSREHVLVAVHTPHALASLVRHDLVTVLGDLAAGPPGGATADARPAPIDPGDPALRAVLEAARQARIPVQSRTRSTGPDLK